MKTKFGLIVGLALLIPLPGRAQDSEAPKVPVEMPTKTDQPSILLDSQEWQKAGVELQDKAIEIVAEKLKADFDLKKDDKGNKAQTYTCGGQSFRIATFIHKTLKAEFNLIPGGRFRMGSDSEDSNQKPAHDVTVPPVLVGVTEVTLAHWVSIDGTDARKWPKGNWPMEAVSLDEFKIWLAKVRGGLRLPSEAEWEYACRAGTTSAFTYGETITPEVVNYDGRLPYGGAAKGLNRNKSVPVGTLPANAFGLHEMHGNLSEWCEDTWHSDYEGAPSDGSVWLGGANEDASVRVVRGGGYMGNPAYCRSASRFKYIPFYRARTFGFRLFKTLP